MIAIDLGTTNSCAAVGDVFGGRAVAVETEQNAPYDTVLRSAVLDPLGDEPVIGERAVRLADQGDPRTYLVSFKPLLDAQQVKTHVWTPRVVGQRFNNSIDALDDEIEWTRSWKGTGHTREELIVASRLLLTRLVNAALEAGGEADTIWLGLPVSFTGIARKRLIAAIEAVRTARGRRLFGGFGDVLRRVRFVLEPVAVAAGPMRDAFDVADDENVLVFDHGGGTLDLSLIRFGRVPGFHSPMPLRELGALGSQHVAGRSIDQALREHLGKRAEFVRAAARLPGYMVDALVERAKIDLSTRSSVEVLGGVALDRRDFDWAVLPVIDGVTSLVRQMLAGAGMDIDDVDRVVMTGGSSLIPCVQDRVAQLFGHLDETRLLRYDPASPDGVKSAITEVAQGLVSFGTQVVEAGVFEQVVLWDLSMTYAPHEKCHRLVQRGTPYRRRSDGTLGLNLRVRVPPREGEGSSFGLYDEQLERRYLFGLCDVPPLPAGARLDITLRPESLAPSVRLVTPDGEPVLAEPGARGWPAGAPIEADLLSLDEDRLAHYFNDDAEYLPVVGYRHFESTPLVRRLRLGDLVEWAEDADGGGPGRDIRRYRGTLIRIRHIDTGVDVQEMKSWRLEDYVFSFREEGTATMFVKKGRTGSLRLAPRPWRDF